MKYKIYSLKHKMYTEDPAWPSNQHVCSKFFVDTDGFVEELVSYDGSNWHYAAPPKQSDFRVEPISELPIIDEPSIGKDKMDELFDRLFPPNLEIKSSPDYQEINDTATKSAESFKINAGVSKDLEARIYKYLGKNGSSTIKMIQSSLRHSVFEGVTCNELHNLILNSPKFLVDDYFGSDTVSNVCCCAK